MNYLYMISRLHFGGPGGDQSTLYDAMNFWTKEKISKSKADFYALEQLIIHSFQAKVCALLGAGLLNRDRRQDLTLRISLECSLLMMLNRFHDFSIRSSILMANTPARPTIRSFRNHILFFQHTQVYLLLKYSIEHADLGLLRRAIDRCCVYFHDSGQSRYAYDMLYLLRLTSTSAATPDCGAR